MVRFTIAVMGICLFLGLIGCSSGPDMKEGEWEISTEMGMKGIPIKMPAMSHTQCLTKDDLIPQGENQQQANCSVSEQKVEGNTVSWKMVCTEGSTETKSEGFITYSGVLFSGKVDITISGGPVSMTANSTITGKYLGPCNN